ncbi:hypothetical protein [Streptomyces sp. NPDC046909]|uniref:hypothetical protein n=1 Tax=Streptomyces sp. NPDC046909 TaxID=3155617 RepID=UPI0033EAE2E4
MSAPATPRTPTPSDLARRPRPASPSQDAVPGATATPTPPPARPYERRQLSAEEAVAPGKLKQKEQFRRIFLLALRRSHMHPHSRLVGHDLMWRANHATGRILAVAQPTVEQLASATGLTTGQVEVALANLHSRGWLHYRRRQAEARADRPAYSLAIPAGVLEEVRALRPNRPAR